MAGVVDTSVLMAVIDSEDAHHGRAIDTLGGHLGVEIPPAVLAEWEGLVRKRSGRAAAVATIPAFLSRNPQVGIMDADLHPRAQAIWRRHGGITYTDAHIIAAALLLGDELITFDERQKAAWKKEKKRD